MATQKRRNAAEQRRTSGVVHKTSMAQSAVEYLSVYGFAILVIVIIAVVLYFFVSAPPNIPQTQCTFTSNIDCKQLVIGSNSLGTKAIFLFSDSQQYAMKNPSITVNVTNIGTFAGSCTPSFIISGGIFECVVSANNKVTPNQLASGQIFISAIICTQPTESGCGSPVSQVFGGTFTTHISPLAPTPQCSISLSIKNPTQLATGTGDEIVANVKLFNTNIAGATVNFTSNSLTTAISDQYVNTASNGNAIAYASSTTAGTSNIIATFGNCAASANLGFVAPLYITFASNIQSSTPQLTIGGTSYSTLPIKIPVAPSTPEAFSFSSSISLSSGSQAGDPSVATSTGCRISSGAVIATSNCTVTGNYLQQFSLTIGPILCGTVTPSPGSVWINSGAQPALDAISNPICIFNNWQCTAGACAPGDSSSSNAITLSPVSGPLTENAMFTPQESLTLDNSGCTSLSASPNEPYYSYGQSVQLSAVVPTGDILSWSGTGTGSYSGSLSQPTVTMDGPITETAICTSTVATYTLSIVVSPSSGGTTNPSAGTLPETSGSTPTLSATPNPNYQFTGWSCAPGPDSSPSVCTSTDSESTSNVITLSAITGNIIETANFQTAAPPFFIIYASMCGGLGGSGWCGVFHYCPGYDGTPACTTGTTTPTLSVTQTIYSPDGSTEYKIIDGSGSAYVSVVNTLTNSQVGTAINIEGSSYGGYIWALTWAPNNMIYALVNLGVCGSSFTSIWYINPANNNQYGEYWTGWPTYAFTHWGLPENGGSVCNEDPYSGTGIGIAFAPNYQYTINLAESTIGSGTGGTASLSSGGSSGTYEIGTNVPFTESANPGYTFLGWECTGYGCYAGPATSANILIYQNTVETAYFANTLTLDTIPSLSCADDGSGDTYCITGQGTYELKSSGTSWSSVSGVVPGAAAGSSVYLTTYSYCASYDYIDQYCYTYGLNLYAVSPTGIYSTQAGSQWSPIGSAPPGSGANEPLACSSDSGGVIYCATNSGTWAFNTQGSGGWSEFAPTPSSELPVSLNEYTICSDFDYDDNYCVTYQDQLYAVTTSGLYESAGGSWSYLTSAPPGLLPGSSISCIIDSSSNINCETSSGVYIYSIPSGGSWSSYLSTAPGASIIGPLSLTNYAYCSAYDYIDSYCYTFSTDLLAATPGSFSTSAGGSAWQVSQAGIPPGT